MSLITHNPRIFYNTLSTDVNLSDDIKLWQKIYSQWGIGWFHDINDRSNNIQTPIRTYVPNRFFLPKFERSNKTYKECCSEKVYEIIQKQDHLNYPIELMYSGGIDSSNVLISFIETIGLKESKDRLTIVMTQESAEENPSLWKKFIRPYFRIESGSFRYHDTNKKTITVTGELNDNIFGYVPRGGNSRLYDWNPEGYKLKANIDNIKKFMIESYKVEEHIALSISKLLLENLKSSPNPDPTLIEAFWWFSFTCLWIGTDLRTLMISPAEDRINPSWSEELNVSFYNSKSFQLWSMNDIEPKDLRTKNTFKWTAKKAVADFIQDQDYLYKTKNKSLRSIVSGRTAGDILGLDTDYNLIKNLDDINRYIDNKNDFSKFL